MIPEATDGSRSDFGTLKAIDIEVEDGEFDGGKDVGVGAGLDALPDLVDGPFQQIADVGVPLGSLAAARNVQCTVDGLVVGKGRTCRGSITPHVDVYEQQSSDDERERS